MYRRTLVSLIAIFACSVIVIALLYSYSLEGRNSKNGFLRLYPPHVVDRINRVVLPNTTSYFIGVESGKIIIGDYKNLQTVIQTDTNLSSLRAIRPAFPITDPFLISQSRIMMDSDNLYAIQQLRSIIYKTSLSSISSARMIMDSPNISSTAAVPLSSSSFILRTYYDPLKQNILTKLTLHKPYFQFGTGILRKQVDGIFCTDGTLLLNREFNRIMYVYTYRNQFICLDSNLKILYQARTIDTNTVAKIQVTEIKAKNQTVLSAPPLTVNRLSCVSGDQLYINSALKANNEAVPDFNRYAVIDVYDTRNGSYKFSFYVVKDHEHPISSLLASQNMLFLIQGNILFIYTLNRPFIQ